MQNLSKEPNFSATSIPNRKRWRLIFEQSARTGRQTPSNLDIPPLFKNTLIVPHSQTNRMTALIMALLVLLGAYVPAQTQLQLCIGEHGHFAIDVVSHVFCAEDCTTNHVPVEHPDDPCHHDHSAPCSSDPSHEHSPCIDLTLEGQEIQRPFFSAPILVGQPLLLCRAPAWQLLTPTRSFPQRVFTQVLAPPDNIRLGTIIQLV
ncbi:MAG: hypothetical protein ACI9TH_001004 [Kiritimatiellia bacterium]